MDLIVLAQDTVRIGCKVTLMQLVQIYSR